MRKLLRAIVALAIIAVPLIGSAPAAAQTACSPDQTLVPPPLRQFLAQCERTDGGAGDILIQFPGWTLYGPIVEAFEVNGWVIDTAVSFLGFGQDATPVRSAQDVHDSPTPSDAVVVMSKDGDEVDIRWFSPDEPAGGLPDGFVDRTSVAVRADGPFPLDDGLSGGAVSGLGRAACDGTRFSPEGSGRSAEYFDPGPAVVPPQLRGTAYSCASKPVGQASDLSYELVYVGIQYDEVVRLLREFAADGWADVAASRTIDLGDGPQQFDLTFDELAALDPPPLLQQNLLSSLEGTITFRYTDGVAYSNDPALTVPNLIVGVILTTAYSTTGIDDPSVLSTLRTISEAAPTPTQTAVICGAAVLLTVVVGWPGALLGGVLSSRYDQLFGWTERGLPKRIRTALKKTQPRWLVWVGFLAAAIVAGFVDPSFGFNLMSLRMLASAFLGFVVFNIVGWAIVRRVAMRLQPDSKPVVNFRWGSLIVVLAAVLIARVLEFQPGVIFGLVAGLTYAVTLIASRKAVVVLIGTAFALAVALVAWVVFSVLSPVTGTNPLLLFVTEFFSGVTIEGISSLPLALLPLTALDGGDLFGWKKWVWGIAYVLGLAAFMLVLLTVPGTFAVFPGDFARWLILFAIYAVVAVGAWAMHGALERRKKRRQASA